MLKPNKLRDTQKAAELQSVPKGTKCQFTPHFGKKGEIAGKVFFGLISALFQNCVIMARLVDGCAKVFPFGNSVTQAKHSLWFAATYFNHQPAFALRSSGDGESDYPIDQIGFTDFTLWLCSSSPAPVCSREHSDPEALNQSLSQN